MFLLVFGLIRANADGWTSPTILTLFAAAGVLMALFVFAELRQDHPLLDLSLFRKPSFTGVSIGTFAIGAGMFALLPYITFYLQNDLGYSPLQGGLRLLPCTLLCFVVPLAMQLGCRRGCRPGWGLAHRSRHHRRGSGRDDRRHREVELDRADSWVAADRASASASPTR